MPAYDFLCLDCQHRMVLHFSYTEYAKAEKRCTRCNSLNLRRVMTKVAIAKSESTRFADFEDESVLDDLAEADPATLGRFMRRMADETGEDLGEEFNTIVERLERGEDPESIEADFAVPEDSLDDEDDSTTESGSSTEPSGTVAESAETSGSAVAALGDE
ncbi:MAG: FmdB family zinc ribbon protein [Anaerolineae bacterium]|nr:hypothetical protein [Anaerolineae bacterium]MDW8298260.1 FmdB family zinc ribbon protein [Anaerolineae bacterium]